MALNSKTYDLIDLLYRTTEDIDPDQDTFKLNWENEFNFSIEKEYYVLDEVNEQDIKDILIEMKPILPKLESYHIAYLNYLLSIEKMLHQVYLSLNT